MRARAAQTSIFSRIVVFLLDRERISVCLGGRRERIGVLFGLRDRMRRVWGVGRASVWRTQAYTMGRACVAAACCVVSPRVLALYVVWVRTPPRRLRERERATCRRMREGRRRTRCVPQRSCGVSHHVCVVCVLYMVFGRVRGAGAFLHERRSLVAVCARVVGGRLSLSKEVSRLPRLPRVNAHAVSGRKRASSSRRRASTSLMSLSTQGAGRVLVKSWPRSANETRR